VVYDKGAAFRPHSDRGSVSPKFPLRKLRTGVKLLQKALEPVSANWVHFLSAVRNVQQIKRLLLERRRGRNNVDFHTTEPHAVFGDRSQVLQ